MISRHVLVNERGATLRPGIWSSICAELGQFDAGLEEPPDRLIRVQILADATNDGFGCVLRAAGPGVPAETASLVLSAGSSHGTLGHGKIQSSLLEGQLWCELSLQEG